VFICSVVTFAEQEPESHRPLCSEESVLAGVMILEGATTDSVGYKKEQYNTLLELSGITHEQFQNWLHDKRDDPQGWFETLELLETYLQE